jgi:hypothetical protein
MQRRQWKQLANSLFHSRDNEHCSRKLLTTMYYAVPHCFHFARVLKYAELRVGQQPGYFA